MLTKYKLLFLSIINFLFEAIKYLYHRNLNTSFINFVETLANHNIFYIKLFQSIGTNTKIFNDVQREYLLKYLDKVPYSSNKIEYNILRDIIRVGNENGNLLLNTNTLQYINSGLIAVVYKTTMHNKDVVLKIKKKDIDTKLYTALDEVELIIDLLSIFQYFKFFYLKDIFLESKFLLVNQLDFNKELCNIKNFYNNNKNTDYVKIPYVYDKFTINNSNMIVMDYLDGTKFTNLKNENKPDYVELIAKFSLKSLLFNRIFHADFHAGNIVFMEENNNKKLGVLDFGIVGYITREEQNIYYNFLKALFVDNNYKNAADILLSQITTKINENHICIIDTPCSEQLKNILHDGFCDGKEIDFYNSYKLNKILKLSNLKLSPSFYKLQYSMGTSYGVCINLSTDKPFLNIISVACKNLMENFD